MARQRRDDGTAEDRAGDIDAIDREHLTRRVAEPAAASLEADSEAGGGHAGPIPARRRDDVEAGRTPQAPAPGETDRERPNAARWPDPVDHTPARPRRARRAALVVGAVILLIVLLIFN